MQPSELAAELGASARSVRAWLRRQYPRSDHERSDSWHLTAEQVSAARTHFADLRSVAAPTERRTRPPSRSRDTSDEAYVINLCDEILGERAVRQHRFDWLLGDPGKSGRRVRLPVDAYYHDHGLVVEYRERQHDEPVPHFDKPDRVTVSGIDRGRQRALYDQRREHEIPAHGLRLVIVAAGDLAHDSRGRLRRDVGSDTSVLRRLLARP